MEPIATYRESRLERRCRFDLFADSIRARGQMLTREFDVTISLSRLHPQFEQLWVYGTMLYSGLCVFVIGFVVLLFLVGDLKSNIPSAVGPTAVAALFGLFLILTNLRKIKIVRFLSDAGVPTIDIACAGRGAARFDEFVALLIEHIQRARAETKPASH